MNLSIVFIILGAVGFLVAASSLALAVAGKRQHHPVNNWTLGLVAGVVLLVGAMAGYFYWRQHNFVPLKLVYSNPAYGIAFKYPSDWKKFQDSMNPVFPSIPIDTTSSFYLPGDGSSRQFGLNSFGGSLLLTAPPGQSVIGVSRNTGTSNDPVWVPMTVGKEGVDTPGTKEVMWSADNTTLTFAVPPPIGSRQIRVDYAVTGWSALIGFVSPDGKCFFVIDVSRLPYGRSFSSWGQTWAISPKTNEGKPPYNEHFISSASAQVSGITGLQKSYTDTQLGGRECKDFAVPANNWAYEFLTSTVQPAKYSERQNTLKAILASVNITTPNPVQ